MERPNKVITMIAYYLGLVAVVCVLSRPSESIQQIRHPLPTVEIPPTPSIELLENEIGVLRGDIAVTKAWLEQAKKREQLEDVLNFLKDLDWFERALKRKELELWVRKGKEIENNPAPQNPDQGDQFKLGLGLWIQESLRTMGYKKAIVFISHNMLKIYNTGLLPDTVAQEVMTQREAVEMMRGWGITLLEVSDGVMLPSGKPKYVRIYPIR